MTCVYDAPRRRGEGQATPASVEQWSGPNGYTLLSWEVDFRPGGASRLFVRSPEGPEYWVEGAQLEIVEPERVVFTGTLAAKCVNSSTRPDTVTFRRTERS